MAVGFAGGEQFRDVLLGFSGGEQVVEWLEAVHLEYLGHPVETERRDGELAGVSGECGIHGSAGLVGIVGQADADGCDAGRDLGETFEKLLVVLLVNLGEAAYRERDADGAGAAGHEAFCALEAALNTQPAGVYGEAADVLVVVGTAQLEHRDGALDLALHLEIFHQDDAVHDDGDVLGGDIGLPEELGDLGGEYSCDAVLLEHGVGDIYGFAEAMAVLVGESEVGDAVYDDAAGADAVYLSLELRDEFIGTQMNRWEVHDAEVVLMLGVGQRHAEAVGQLGERICGLFERDIHCGLADFDAGIDEGESESGLADAGASCDEDGLASRDATGEHVVKAGNTGAETLPGQVFEVRSVSEPGIDVCAGVTELESVLAVSVPPASGLVDLEVAASVEVAPDLKAEADDRVGHVVFEGSAVSVGTAHFPGDHACEAGSLEATEHAIDEGSQLLGGIGHLDEVRDAVNEDSAGVHLADEAVYHAVGVAEFVEEDVGGGADDADEALVLKLLQLPPEALGVGIDLLG